MPNTKEYSSDGFLFTFVMCIVSLGFMCALGIWPYLIIGVVIGVFADSILYNVFFWPITVKRAVIGRHNKKVRNTKIKIG